MTRYFDVFIFVRELFTHPVSFIVSMQYSSVFFIYEFPCMWAR